tara:strand:- start:146 stop:532 length:387 start_codon:yes stop_codon:yes gene_type:complete
MPSRNITFDPDSGVPSASNLNLYTGADFSLNLNVKTVSNSAFDLTNYTGSSQLQKTTGIGATISPNATFTVGITSAADGLLNVSLGSTDTRSLSEGRYMYDVLVSSGSTVYTLVNGSVYVYSGISSAP